MLHQTASNGLQTKLPREFQRLGLEASNVWLAACWIMVKLYEMTCCCFFFFYIKTIPQRSVKSNFCSWVHLKHKRSHLQRWHKSRTFLVFDLLCDRRHRFKWFLWLAIRASCVRPRAGWSYSVIFEENGERESMCLSSSWMCSHNCAVRSCCCFNLFHPHGF